MINIETDGLEPDDAKLTGHLKSPDFFEVKKFPEAKFVSTGIKAEKEGFTVTGDLTLRGKTKSIKFPAKIENKNGTATLNADFKIKRSDWGMTYGAGMIDDDVKLTVSVKAK